MGAEFTLVVIKSWDIENLKAFYEDLGIEFQEERHGDGSKHYSANLGGITFEIYPKKKSELEKESKPSRGTGLGFKVKNLEEVLNRRLVMHVIKIVSPIEETPWGRRAVVKDPDGRRVELYDS